MTQGERVKTIRKSLNLTLEKFGEKLGVSRSAVSNIEVGYRGLTEQMIRSICREYQISEEWLRTGTGEMHLSLSKHEKISSFFGTLLNESEDSYKLRFIETLADLEPEEWRVLERITCGLIRKEK